MYMYYVYIDTGCALNAGMFDGRRGAEDSQPAARNTCIKSFINIFSFPVEGRERKKVMKTFAYFLSRTYFVSFGRLLLSCVCMLCWSLSVSVSISLSLWISIPSSLTYLRVAVTPLIFITLFPSYLALCIGYLMFVDVPLLHVDMSSADMSPLSELL